MKMWRDRHPKFHDERDIFSETVRVPQWPGVLLVSARTRVFNASRFDI